jgi:hypothetical protein
MFRKRCGLSEIYGIYLVKGFLREPITSGRIANFITARMFSLAKRSFISGAEHNVSSELLDDNSIV